MHVVVDDEPSLQLVVEYQLLSCMVVQLWAAATAGSVARTRAEQSPITRCVRDSAGSQVIHPTYEASEQAIAGAVGRHRV